MSFIASYQQVGRPLALALLATLAYFAVTSVALPDPPPCDGSTLGAEVECGTERGCNPATPPCSGSTVKSLTVAQCVGGGSPNEKCETDPKARCTETRQCGVSDPPPIPGQPERPPTCIGLNPVMNGDDPVISTAPAGALVACYQNTGEM